MVHLPSEIHLAGWVCVISQPCPVDVQQGCAAGVCT